MTDVAVVFLVVILLAVAGIVVLALVAKLANQSSYYRAAERHEQAEAKLAEYRLEELENGHNDPILRRGK